MSLLLKACIYAVAAAAIIAVIRTVKPEFTVPLAVAAGIGLVIICVDGVLSLVSSLDRIKEIVDSKYISLLLKIGGICCVCRLCADVCMDCGVVTLASRVISLCRISVCILCVPMLLNVITLIADLCGI